MRKVLGAFFTEISRAFGCIDHSLLITKLYLYGMTPKSLNIIFSYLSNWTQGVRISNSYIRKSGITYGVPKGSMFQPLLFNIHLIVLLLQCKDDNITSYIDDNILCAQQMSSAVCELQNNCQKKFNWCKNNTEKSHVILSSNTQRVIRFDNASITSSLSVKLLGITFYSDLKFEKQINKICTIVHKKLNVLHRIASYISLEKR